jgi:hypothetical protein
MQLISSFHLQLQIYSVTFLALTDTNSSITQFKLIVLEYCTQCKNKSCPGKGCEHQFCTCHLMHHKSLFRRVRNLLILKILVSVTALHPRPTQLPCLPPLVKALNSRTTKRWRKRIVAYEKQKIHKKILTIKLQMTRPCVIGSLDCEGMDWLLKAGGGSNEVHERTLAQ